MHQNSLKRKFWRKSWKISKKSLDQIKWKDLQMMKGEPYPNTSPIHSSEWKDEYQNERRPHLQEIGGIRNAYMNWNDEKHIISLPQTHDYHLQIKFEPKQWRNFSKTILLRTTPYWGKLGGSRLTFMENRIKKDFIAYTCINLFVITSDEFIWKLITSQKEEEHFVSISQTHLLLAKPNWAWIFISEPQVGDHLFALEHEHMIHLDK